MILTGTTWLLISATIYLSITSFILLRNRMHFTSLERVPNNFQQFEKISVCVPARNEEKNIGKLLSSLADQTYPEFKVHVLDDHSEDRTPEVIESFVNRYPEIFHLHYGKPKPGNWLGKPWACKQLSEFCTGEYIVFLDADTELMPKTLHRIFVSFQTYQIDMLTIWPRQILGSFWEKTVIPLIYYALLSLLPAIYVYRDPKWMPSFLINKMRSSFAAANGQCLAFKKKSYLEIGGHHSVKNKIVEDVELAKKIKKEGYSLRMFNGLDSIQCRMYQNENEIFEGLRKNFLAGFNYSVPLFILFALIHIVVFVLPFITLIISLFMGYTTMLFYSVIPVSIILLHRLWLSNWFEWNPLYSFLHPIGVLWFQRLGIVKLLDVLLGRKSEWKGREV